MTAAMVIATKPVNGAAAGLEEGLAGLISSAVDPSGAPSWSELTGVSAGELTGVSLGGIGGNVVLRH